MPDTELTEILDEMCVESRQPGGLHRQRAFHYAMRFINIGAESAAYRSDCLQKAGEVYTRRHEVQGVTELRRDLSDAAVPFGTPGRITKGFGV
jgi:hypothetical protein